MVMPDLTFIVEDEDVLVALHALLSATSGPSLGLFLETVVEGHFEQRAFRRFASEGDSASGKWEELLFPETVDIRESLGFPGEHPINRRTGELMDWVTSAGGTTTVFGAGSGAILSWPDVPSGGELKEKYVTAQTGKADPYTPSRPVVAMDAIDLAFTLQALEAWIVNAVENPTGSWRL